MLLQRVELPRFGVGVAGILDSLNFFLRYFVKYDSVQSFRLYCLLYTEHYIKIRFCRSQHWAWLTSLPFWSAPPGANPSALSCSSVNPCVSVCARTGTSKGGAPHRSASHFLYYFPSIWLISPWTSRRPGTSGCLLGWGTGSICWLSWPFWTWPQLAVCWNLGFRRSGRWAVRTPGCWTDSRSSCASNPSCKRPPTLRTDWATCRNCELHECLCRSPSMGFRWSLWASSLTRY
jgi:hypothetical protein